MSGLTPKQLEAVSGISKGLTPSQIATVIGVSARTVERWQKLPEFIATLAQIQSEVSHRVRVEVVEDVASISSRLENLASKSFNYLEEIVDDEEARTSDRLQAAKVLIANWQQMQPPRMSEMESLKVLIEANWIDDNAINVLVKSWETLSSEMKDVLRGGK
jgi:maltodextrin utilization protein YvdJ